MRISTRWILALPWRALTHFSDQARMHFLHELDLQFAMIFSLARMYFFSCTCSAADFSSRRFCAMTRCRSSSCLLKSWSLSRSALSSAKLMAVMCALSAVSSRTWAGRRASRARRWASSSPSSRSLALSSIIRTSTCLAAAAVAFLIASSMMPAILRRSSSSIRRLSSSSLSDTSSIVLIEGPRFRTLPSLEDFALPGLRTLCHDWCSLPPGDAATSLLGVDASLRGVWPPRVVPTRTLIHLAWLPGVLRADRGFPGLGVHSPLRGDAMMRLSSSWTCTERPGCRDMLISLYPPSPYPVTLSRISACVPLFTGTASTATCGWQPVAPGSSQPCPQTTACWCCA
mmetsp:Transcript_6789/g.17367  ORF Transcript_6789/g.17367 Transcript_6789/m.17367 type:complete len:343 (-) Transcript_6789:119-1147(-)